MDTHSNPISASELPQALVFARVTATKRMSSSKGQDLIKDMATSMRCSVDDARRSFLMRVQHGVVARAHNDDTDPLSLEKILKEILGSDYKGMTLPRIQTAASHTALALIHSYYPALPPFPTLTSAPPTIPLLTLPFTLTPHHCSTNSRRRLRQKQPRDHQHPYRDYQTDTNKHLICFSHPHQ